MINQNSTLILISSQSEKNFRDWWLFQQFSSLSLTFSSLLYPKFKSRSACVDHQRKLTWVRKSFITQYCIFLFHAAAAVICDEEKSLNPPSLHRHARAQASQLEFFFRFFFVLMSLNASLMLNYNAMTKVCVCDEKEQQQQHSESEESVCRWGCVTAAKGSQKRKTCENRVCFGSRNRERKSLVISSLTSKSCTSHDLFITVQEIKDQHPTLNTRFLMGPLVVFSFCVLPECSLTTWCLSCMSHNSTKSCWLNVIVQFFPYQPPRKCTQEKKVAR